MSKFRVIIVHGWEGSPNSNWFPWLKSQIERDGGSCVVPDLPTPDLPVMEDWLEKLGEVIGQPDNKTFLVGHSLGCITILRYLERLQKGRIGGAVLVAGFAEPLGYPELENFFTAPVDFANVRQACSHFLVLQSDDDRYVPIRYGEQLRDELDARYILVNNAGHFNQSNGITMLPQALHYIEKKMGLDPML